MNAFTTAEIGLIVEALERAGKRQASEAKWLYVRHNKKLGDEHHNKARAMLKLVAKLQPLTGLQGTVKS